jgi:hypothetical protein
LENETVWLTQKLMADLFQKDVRTINEHIQNIYEEGELSPDSTIRKFRIVQTEGTRQVSREMDFCNLDVIISVGYRVKSHRGTQFRIWATQRIREYIVKRNKHVPLYLLGRKKLPRNLPDYYSLGDNNEAIMYACGNLAAWNSTPGALEWLKAKVRLR